MKQFSPEELTKNAGNSVYKLVLLASRRTAELIAGAPRLIEDNSGKAASIALEEIKEGKVRIKTRDDE